eukprot:scaffold581116_cov36-Prasinocladus_malaysianus.AAC.1
MTTEQTSNIYALPAKQSEEESGKAVPKVAERPKMSGRLGRVRKSSHKQIELVKVPPPAIKHHFNFVLTEAFSSSLLHPA